MSDSNVRELHGSSLMAEHMAWMLARLPAAFSGQHMSSRLVCLTRQAMQAAGHRCGEIDWNHADGAHRFTVETEFGPHEITVAPPGNRARNIAELARLRDQLRQTAA